MRRRLAWVVLALVILLLVGAVVAVLTLRPSMSDARDTVDRTWTPLRAPLVVRYQALAGVNAALDAAGANSRSVTQDLNATLMQWNRVAHLDDPATQAPLANQLEGLALRAKANLVASSRLQADPTLNAAFAAFDRAVVSPPAVRAYNQAVGAYQQSRTGTIRRLVADTFGFDARPELQLAGG